MAIAVGPINHRLLLRADEGRGLRQLLVEPGQETPTEPKSDA
jgi:hypothetical protein